QNTATHDDFKQSLSGAAIPLAKRETHELRKNDSARVRSRNGQHAQGFGASAGRQARLAAASEVEHDRLERKSSGRNAGLGGQYAERLVTRYCATRRSGLPVAQTG